MQCRNLGMKKGYNFDESFRIVDSFHNQNS